ncbi:MAG: CRTAC1 family protein [Chthonomonadaceae bacterium]|nr:CRTAC1 family protein [Chthonomonadaceae bacterium]
MAGTLVGCRGHSGNATAAVPASVQQSHSYAERNPPLFVNRAREAGLNYRWEVTGKRPLNILQTIGNGAAFLDFDKDGNLDILLVGPRVALYRGDGRGHFTDVSQATGVATLRGNFLGCAVGDYDNDGYADVYLSAYRGGALLHNEAGKRFREVTRQAGIASQPWGTSCSFTDIDSDGRLDLYIGNYVVFGPRTKPQLCDFSGILSSCGPRFYFPERGVLYRNLGNGRFQDVTRLWKAHRVSGKALGVAAADFDGSGRQSIAIANDEVPGDLLANRGRYFDNIGPESGTAFDDDGSVHGGMGIDWGDYDNDGRLDLVVATFQNEVKNIYRSEGESLFKDMSKALGVAAPAFPYVAFGVKFFDMDNDGFLDLMFANGHVQDNINEIDKGLTYRQPVQLFRNREGQRYEDLTSRLEFGGPNAFVGRGLAVGDYDNDGRVDVLVVDSEGEPLLMHNESPETGNWLSLRLEGRKSNRMGIGALVTVELEGKRLLRHCTTDGSYMSASDARVHVGIGQVRSATVRVRWPSGAVSVHAALPVNRTVTLREP